MESDPIIDEIREVRHRISEEHAHDPTRLVDYYTTLEREEYADRLVKRAEPAPAQRQERERR